MRPQPQSHAADASSDACLFKNAAVHAQPSKISFAIMPTNSPDFSFYFKKLLNEIKKSSYYVLRRSCKGAVHQSSSLLNQPNVGSASMSVAEQAPDTPRFAMGCFASTKTRSSPTLRSFLTPKQTPVPPSGLKHSPASFRARALRSASRLARNQPRALSASSHRSASLSPPRKEILPHHGDALAVHHPVPPCASENGISHLFPLPLPLPPSDDTSSQSVSSAGSGCSTSSTQLFSSTGSGSSSVAQPSNRSPLSAVGVVRGSTIAPEHPPSSQPLPLPPPPESGAVVKEFSVEEIALACQNFAPEFWIRDGVAGPVFRAIVKNVSEEAQTLEVTVTRLTRSRSQSLRKWRAEVSSLCRLSHPHLCRVVGFSAENASRRIDRSTDSRRERLLVYENTSNGSLDTLLYGRTEKAPLDWSSRSKIALGAAKGLAFLHERSPRQILYRSFKTINIQVDEEFHAKLSDYGFAASPGLLSTASPARALVADDPYIAPETRLYDALSAKSNVWSFGIVLLELMSGRQNMDEMFPLEERNLVQWARPRLMDVKRLYLIMDPELKGRYATSSAKRWADITLQCLTEDPLLRPSMREVAIALSAASASKRDPVSDVKTFKARRNSFGIVLGSPGRSLIFRSSPYEPRSNWVLGFLSGEITKESSKASSVSHMPGPQSQYGFFSGEILQVRPSLIAEDNLAPPLGRSISSGPTAVSGG